MQEIDWAGIYQASLPLIDGYHGSAKAKVIKLFIFFSFLSLFILFFMKKKVKDDANSTDDKPLYVHNPLTPLKILIILSPLIVAGVIFTPILAKNFGNPYVISGTVESKELSGRYDIPKVKIKVEEAFEILPEGKAGNLPDKIGEKEVMATTELYKFIKKGNHITLVSMANDQVFGMITKDAKIFIPLLQDKKKKQ
ncbi:MAG: hypothetical protein HQK84_07540 [Nitrospinae bacterium]|nr:hypothetical protein [Nitrospinota bacterium]